MAKQDTTNKNEQGKRKDAEPGTLVRINPRDKAILQELANREGETMPKIIHKALEAYRREIFLHGINTAYDSLKVQTEGWSREVEEREVWNQATDEDQEEDE